MNIEFTARESGGVEIVDPIERVHYTLNTPKRQSVSDADSARFRFPVDAAVQIHCKRITLPTVPATLVRDGSGSVVTQIEHFSDGSLPDGEYEIELSLPLKVYIRVESAIEFSSDDEQLVIDFGKPTDVSIGARSKHEQPAGTITTTEQPRDIMQTVSALGSSLKTTSPERSLPTLRGHPPEIELGERLSIPDGITAPDTEIELQVPLTYEHVFPAAPLAYYLGATMCPGEEPRIVTGDGYTQELIAAPTYEERVARTLKQVFFLDCVTRTEGLYPVPLRERSRLEERIELPFNRLYELPPADRLATYLDAVAYSDVDDLLPDWKLTTHVSPTAGTIETLPYLINDLAIVRIADPQELSRSSVEDTGMGAYTRGADTRSATGQSPDTTYVQLDEDDDAVEQAWIGDETPVGLSKAIPEAYRNRFDREPSSGDISITVICNDDRMDRERGVVDEVYGSRERLPFEVSMSHDLTTEELADALAQPADFLHYIGHIEDGGFRCTDGLLDASELDSVAVDAFLLNACQSYHQGRALIENGAIGGVVTLSDVINSGAIRIGSTLARLLNSGFPLRAALQIAKGESIVGSQYLVIGDGGLAITQAESGTPLLGHIEEQADEYELTLEAFPTTSGGMGGLIQPNVESISSYKINSGPLDPVKMTREELLRFLQLEMAPMKMNGRLRWSTELTAELSSD
ncbi:CHAT domain-containing protein [Natranaeroarchaeum sulfidigenes]|uniref:CHAT domain-containing protein n=1 Tax=Natranaeroarchaeum sulfidigenes TaxID=2784880 RepID=A0A897MNY3_9EURY|nr:CHAT domain-containing protein [Natranaeroarchaeum sulfidigenes]QSG02092.1 Uncharacterized protein AArcS_0869 [Natranaeroarchaeum sulfidigenes]